jgi:glycosyltransferase involved in cell wall biosynthesis
MIPNRIVCCSESARRVHATYGYAAHKLAVVPNGFDLNQFCPDPQARSSFRRELGIAEDVRLIGVAARFHVLKGHRNFFDAAARLQACMPEVHFVLCGRDVDRNNAELAGWLRAAGPGLEARCHLLGVRQDMPRFFAALDIATSPSLSEAFPSAVGEAMACGTPCVVTDVGDSAVLVGDTGIVVPSGDSDALAQAWKQLLNCDPAALLHLGARARDRIRRRFAVEVAVERYQQVYREVFGRTSTVPAEEISGLDTGERTDTAAATGGRTPN